MTLKVQIASKKRSLHKQRQPIWIINPHLLIRYLRNIKPLWLHLISLFWFTFILGSLKNMYFENLRLTIIIHANIAHKLCIFRSDAAFLLSLSDCGFEDCFTVLFYFPSESVIFILAEAFLLHG